MDVRRGNGRCVELRHFGHGDPDRNPGVPGVPRHDGDFVAPGRESLGMLDDDLDAPGDFQGFDDVDDLQAVPDGSSGPRRWGRTSGPTRQVADST